MKCPICGSREFYKRVFEPNKIVVNFTTREVLKRRGGRKEFIYCTQCGYKLNRDEQAMFNKAMRWMIEDV